MYVRLFIFTIIFISVIVTTSSKTLSHGSTTEFWDETEPFGQAGSPSPDLRLPSSVVPSFYRLKLNIDLDHSNFSGEVYITIRANQRVKEIILHSKNLSINSDAKLTEQIYEKVDVVHSKSKRDVSENVTVPLENNVSTTLIDNNTIVTEIKNETIENGNISTKSPDPIGLQTTHETITTLPTPVDTQITHSTVRNIKILSITEGTGDRLILTLASALTPNVDYTLQLSFKGDISNSLTGFYKSTYTNSKQEVKKLGVTQFEPTSARAAFPCFDEPAFKAKFEISIAHPAYITALSNMKVAAQEMIPEQPGWQWTHFERSIKMSTYLVAYVLSDFKSLETSYVSKDNLTKPIRVWTRPELIEKANYAINITPKLLDYYEDLFGVPYALDKLDLIAIPDFSSGAMENWGLITFRETTLLFDEKEGVPRDKQNVAIDIAHELAHQWFGNLVTMRWWTDLWLNEGFATYVEYVGVDHIEPSWNMLESLTRDKMDLLRSDALKNTSPVSRKVIDASEITQKFDEISYTKGSNLIRMLNHTITEDLFHKGLVLYLNKWQYTNAEENDLWESMSKATDVLPEFNDLSLVEFMNSWTRQAGYPVVNVIRNYETGEVEFRQTLFTSTKEPYQNMVDQIWHIPISYTALNLTHGSDDWTAKPKIWLNDRAKTFTLPINDSEALYVNVDAVGYYRVNYDKKNWELLSTALKSGHVNNPIMKAQLIDDAFNLAKGSQLNYSYALGLTTCVIDGEDAKIVWDLLLNNMGFLRHNLKATSGFIYFQDYMRLILKKQLERLNYGLKKPKNDNEAFLIENLVMWECFVESPRCLRWAKEEFNKWAKETDINNNPIPSYLRGLVYNIVLKHGGREEFDFLWKVFLNSTDPTVKSIVINNLPSTNSEGLITMLLEKSLDEIPKQYAIAAWSVEAPVGTRLAQDFLINNFRQIYDKFTEMDPFMFPSVLSGAFGFISNVDELNKLKAFAMEHKQELMPMSQTLQKLIDAATLRIDWIKRYAADINRWFQDYVTGTSTMTVINNVPASSHYVPNNTTGGLNITEVTTTTEHHTNPPNNISENKTSL